MFNYETCTEDEAIQHIYNSSRQSLEQAINRYKAKGMTDVVQKLQHAKVKAKCKKLMESINAS